MEVTPVQKPQTSALFGGALPGAFVPAARLRNGATVACDHHNSGSMAGRAEIAGKCSTRAARATTTAATSAGAWGAIALLLGACKRLGRWDGHRQRRCRRRRRFRPSGRGTAVRALADPDLAEVEDQDLDHDKMDLSEITPSESTEAGEAVMPPVRNRVALLLNRNARGVNDKVQKKLREIVGTDDCFVCSSFDDADRAIREVLERGCYAAIACGGGDGTLTSILNLVAKEHKAGSYKVPPPALAVLRLGTGNALSPLLGAGSDPVKNLRDLVRRASTGGVAAVRSWPAKLLDLRFKPVEGSIVHETPPELEDGIHDLDEDKVVIVDTAEAQQKHDTLAFFAGLGFDALMLKDYFWLRNKTDGSRFLRPWVHSPFGYVMALFMRTLPAAMRGKHLYNVRVINNSEEAFYVDPRRGDWCLPRKKGEVLFEGKCGIVSIGAVPFYGGGFKLFPFAGIRGGFAHLRLSNVNPLGATLNMPKLWNGSYRNKNHVWDFLVRDVVIEVDRPVPLQHSGDLVGEVKRLHVCVPEDDSHGAQLVDLMAPVEHVG